MGRRGNLSKSDISQPDTALRSFKSSLTATLLALTAGSASAAVFNIAPDGSGLEIEDPWTITGPSLCPPKSMPLHAFRRDDLEANICLLAETKDTAKDLIDSLWATYEKDLIGRKLPNPATSERLKGGITIQHFTINTPPGFILGGKACLLDAFFKRGKLLYMYVAAQPQTSTNKAALKTELKDFEKKAKEGFRLIEKVEWSPPKAKGSRPR